MPLAHPRRILWPITRSLACGLLITIAISWSIAAWMPLHATSQLTYTAASPILDNGLIWMAIDEYRGFGWVRRRWDTHRHATLRISPFEVATSNYADEIPTKRFDDFHGPAPIFQAWGTLPAELADRQNAGDGLEHAAGWPLPALWYGKRPTTPWNSWQISMFEGLSLPAPAPRTLPSLFSSISEYRALPLQPIWPGLLINTLTWALLACLIGASLSTLRSKHRRRRGLCPRCAYDRLHDYTTPCPECGQPAPAAAA